MLKLSEILLLALFLLSPVLPASLPNANSAAESYDYVVVGSGPGGGPLASNLARAGYSVLLIEAGDQSVATGSNQYPPQITWDFFVKHYESNEKTMMNNHLTWRRADGSYWVGRQNPPADAKLLGVYYPRGATLGGSSMINAMATWLPADSDWNYVVNVTGDTSWEAANMRKLFQRLEHNNYLTAGTPGHGFDGYFQTTMNKPTTLQEPVLGVMRSTAKALGKDSNNLIQMMGSDPNFLDANRDKTEGIWGLASHTYPNGTRYSSRYRVTETIAGGFPLTLRTNSLATRVLFDSSNATACGGKPRATGVEYLQGTSLYMADNRYKSTNKGTLVQVTAKKEVIISGGTFNSPQLLMLSGIGAADQLKQFNISVLVDSPGVGRNLQDNQEMPIIGQVQGGGGFGQGGFVMRKTPYAPEGERDMFVMQGTFAFRGFWPSNQTNQNLPVDPAGTYGLSMVKQHPQNRAGYVRLRSSNPQDTPDINFNLYTEGKYIDLEAMKDTIAWGRRIYASTAAPSGPVKPIEPPCPAGPDAQGSCGAADEDWIIGQTFGHHPTSTCAIGGEQDANAVLDSKFRVKGVKGLRVVDASVFPRIPGVFPVVATFMVSEKATDSVLGDAKGDVCSS